MVSRLFLVNNQIAPLLYSRMISASQLKISELSSDIEILDCAGSWNEFESFWYTSRFPYLSRRKLRTRTLIFWIFPYPYPSPYRVFENFQYPYPYPYPFFKIIPYPSLPLTFNFRFFPYPVLFPSPYLGTGTGRVRNPYPYTGVWFVLVLIDWTPQPK